MENHIEDSEHSSSDEDVSTNRKVVVVRKKKKLCLMGALICMHLFKKYATKSPYKTCQIAGWKFVTSVLESNTSCSRLFRMSVDGFVNLCAILQEDYELVHSRDVRVEEQVAMFLLIVGHGWKIRVVAEIFKKSTQTVAKFFHAVLRATTKMSIDWIKPSSNTEVHHSIRNNKKYWPHFKDCIGAIDGTHVHVIIPVEEQPRFIGRKGYPSQNILAVCDFDMCFIFVKPGWEGSAHDTRIFLHTLRDPRSNFPWPVPPQFYLVDSGYPNKIGFLAPYKGERYHLPEFQRGELPRNAQEKFNAVHSSLRSVIERAFGVWKIKWRIFKDMQAYKFEDQVCMVCATMAIHNFLRRRKIADEEFEAFDEDPDFVPSVEDDDPNVVIETPNISILGTADPEMEAKRNEMCYQICSNNNRNSL